MTAYRELEYNIEIFTNNREHKSLIDKKLSAFADNYENNPRYKSGRWDGKTRFYKTMKANDGILFIISKGFRYLVSPDILDIYDDYILGEQEKIEDSEILSFLKRVLPELPFKPYSHQLKALTGLLKNELHLGIIPTGGGKSLIIYLYFRYFWEKQKRLILVVPTIGLTTQMYEDMKAYNAPKEMIDSIKLIGGENNEKDLNAQIIVSTWQSLAKSMNQIKEYDCIFVDECHQLKAEILSQITSQDVKRKCGVTGSFPIIEEHQMYLIQAVGQPTRYITARELMDLNLLTDTTIMSIFINYPRKITKSGMKYQDQTKFIRECEPRGRFVKSLLEGLKGVTVALYSVTAHGEKTYEDLTGVKLTNKMKSDFEMMKKYNVFFMSGSTKSSVREKIRVYLNDCENAIVIGQQNVLSTGINIPRLKNLVFLSSSKSFTLVLQSIGRVMRLHKEKGQRVYVFDLVDCFSYKKETYSLRHFWQRLKYYQSEKHPVLEREIDLEKYLGV